MQINLQTKKYFWTKHIQEKMKYYNLSESRLKRVFRHAHRVETGIAENTLAAMQTAGSSKHPYEVWLMYQIKDELIKMISAWRYPGKTKVGDKIPVPEDIEGELGIVIESSLNN